MTLNGVDYSRFSNSTFCGVAPLQWPLASSATFPYGRPGDINYIAKIYCAPFRFVPMWSLDYIEPPLGPEYGGTAVELTGNDFLPDAFDASCVFREPGIDLRLPGPTLPGNLKITTDINGSCTTKMLPVPKPQVLIYDTALTACLLQRPYDPDCNRTATVDCNGLMINSSEAQLDFVPGYRRSVCLPPNLACQWDPFDPTTSQLDCVEQSSALGTAEIAIRPDPNVPVVVNRVLLVSMDLEHWASAPADELECHLIGVTALSSGYDMCETKTVNLSVFKYYERPNVTNIHADISPFNVSTIVTVIGEGFQNSSLLAVLLTPRPPDLTLANAHGWGSGAPAENVTYVDPFTIVATLPRCEWAGRLLSPVMPLVTVDARVAINGQDFTPEPMPFYYARLWNVTSVKPWQGRMTGGLSVTVYGPFFHRTRELICRFGNYPATASTFLTSTSILCRTPSVVGHGRMSVEVRLLLFSVRNIYLLRLLRCASSFV